YDTALVQIVGMEELLALTFTLLAFLAFDARGPKRMAFACVAFAAALLSKEIVVLLPLVLLAPLPPEVAWRRRLTGVAALLAVSAAYLTVFAITRGALAVSTEQAYETHYGINLAQNLLTYVAWAANLRDASPDIATVIAPVTWTQGLG